MPALTARNFWTIYASGVLLMLLALRFYYLGEEPIFPIESQEMWEQGIWHKKLMYGSDVLQPPLFNWLIALFTPLVGWVHVQEVARTLTIAATTGTGLMLAWLVTRLSHDRLLAALAAATYLTFLDVLLYHGWLAYTDTVFACFIFSAMALLWIAAEERRRSLLLLSCLAIVCAFLAKNVTAYAFYGATAFVLLLRQETRRFALDPLHIAMLLAALAFPLLWSALIPEGAAQNQGMMGEIMRKLTGANSGGFSFGDYLVKRLSYLLETLSEFLPTAVLALYVLLRRIVRSESLPGFVRTGGWIALLSYLPFLLSPEGGIRYLLPIYPLFALLVAATIYQAGEIWIRRARNWMLAMLALQLAVFLVIFPLYQKHYRGENYFLAAQEIARIAEGQPLYSNDASSAGLIVTAYLNKLRQPLPALHTSPGATIWEAPERKERGDWDNGFVVARSATFPDTRVVKVFPLAADTLYLLCRGKACELAR